MAAEDILGISAQMDISDIQKAFDNIINNLNSLGVKTDEVSSKMSKALNDISQSAVSDGEKTKQAIEVYKNGIAEINKVLETTPEQLKKLGSEATTAEATLGKLKQRLSEVEEGSTKWNGINEQIKNQQQLVNKLNGEYDTMLGTFGSTQQYVGSLNAAIEALNAGRSISTAATGASAVAHVGAAAAVGSEAVAHGENSTKISEETKVTQENTEAKLKLTKTEEEYAYNAQMEAEQIQKVAQRLAEGRSDEEEYINTKKSGMAVREAIVQKMEAEKQKIKELNDLYANSQDANGGTATPEVQQQYNEGVKEATDNLKEYRSELTTINSSLEELESGHFKAKTAINEQAEATDNLKNKTEEAKEASDVYFMGEKATIESVTKAMQDMEAELKSLKEEEKSLKGASGDNTEKLKENEEGQKRLNQYISEGHEALRQLGTNYKEAQKAAKEVVKETKDIGDKADDAAKKVGGIFSKFKGAIGGALKGDFSGLWGMLGKIGTWGAGLAMVGKGLYDLTIQAEKFRAALQPLSHYIDGDDLADVRQNILALSSTTTKSVDDMAKAVTQFVKVWDSLRDSPDALTTMIKAANEFGALSGKTSEEAAKYLATLASEYHMTAQEATEASSMIATASYESTSTFGEMADALKSVGSTAAMYGVSFRDMATLIGYSSNQFGGASQAASKFSMLLMSMSKLQKEYNPSVVGMTTALENLKAAYDRGEDVESKFMARNKAAAMYFIKNADAISKYGKHIDDTKAKQYLLNDANAKASTNIAKLQNAWSGFLTSINANITPTLTRILNFFTKIIGGAQKTADELNYLANYDKIHKKDGKGQRDTTMDTTGFVSATNESDKQEGLALYRRQRDALTKRYNNQLKYYRNRYSHASIEALTNMTNNAMVRYFEGARGKYSEFDASSFNKWIRAKNATVRDLNQRAKNTKVDLGNFTPTPDKDKDKLAEQQRQYREQQAEQQAKQLADDKKIEWELYIAEQEKGIAEMHEGNEKELAQRKLDFEKKKHQIEEEAESLRQKNISVAKAAYDKNPANKKKEGFYASGLDKNVTLTDEQQKLVNAKMELLNIQQEEDNKKRLAAELQSLYDYLKEYGTIQEQRYAIAKEYDDKILKATDENQKKILQRQKEAALAQTDAKKLAMGIDWGASFSGVGTVLRDLAKDTLSKVEAYMKTSDFKSLGANDKKSYVDLRNNLRQETGDNGFSPFNFSKWNEVAQDVRTYQESVRKLQQISSVHSKAVENYEKAQDELKNATTKKAKELAQIKVVTAKKIAEGTGQQQTNAEGEVDEAQQNLVTSTDDATKGLQAFQQMLGNITSGSLSGFAKGIGKLIASIAGDDNKVAQAFQGLGSKIGGLIGAILSIIDALGDDPAKFIEELLNKITKVIEAVLSQLPQIIFSAVKGIGNIIGGVIKGLGNLFSGGKLFGSNTAKMEAEIAELSASNKELASAIDDLKNAIEDDDNTNQKSVEAYKNAVNAQKEWNENQRKAISDRASEWSNSGHGFLGMSGRSSFNKHANDDKGSWLSDFNSTLKKFGYSSKISSASDVWNLSSEEMQVLRDFSPKAWAAFFKAGSGGQANPKDLVDEYIDKAGVEEELTDALNKKLTGYDWSGFKGSYNSMLKDLKSDTTDFADFVTETINNAAIDSFMNNTKSQEWAKKIQKMIADAASDGEITKTEADAIRKENDLYADYLLSERKKLIDSGVIKETSSQSEQSATGKGIEAVTADQASSLIGIGYAMQVALEQGNEVRKAISIDVTSLRVYAETIGNNISEMRDIQYQGLEQLQAINKNTAPIINMNDLMGQIYKLMKERY